MGMIGNTPYQGIIQTGNVQDAAVTAAKLAAAAVTDKLGYTPANKAGDTFTGDVLLSNGVLGVGSSSNVVSAKNWLYRSSADTTTLYAMLAFIQQCAIAADHAWTFRTGGGQPMRLSYSDQFGWTNYKDLISFDGPNGAVTFPSNPGFKATLSGSPTSTSAMTSLGSNLYVVPFDTATSGTTQKNFNDGNFNTSTYTYTVPADGKYILTALVAYLNLGSGSYYGIQVNGSYVIQHDNYTHSGWDASPMSVVAKLSKGDTVRVVMMTSGNTSTYYAEGGSWGGFSAQLIG